MQKKKKTKSSKPKIIEYQQSRKDKWENKITGKQKDIQYDKIMLRLNFSSYFCSYCLDVLKVAAILLKVDRVLVEEPLKSHIQWRVVCCFAAQYDALPYGHLHSARAQHHTHGLWKQKTAALSPQANPKSNRCIFFFHISAKKKFRTPKSNFWRDKISYLTHLD